LNGVNFQDADLGEADFCSANLNGAVLDRATLDAADLGNSDLGKVNRRKRNMSAIGSLAALKIETKPRSWVRTEPALGLVVGLGGGMLQSLALGTPIPHGLTVGGLFGLAFGVFFARRATSAGAGLIWGLATALLACSPPSRTSAAVRRGRPFDGCVE